jgi:four helix bundle protein
MKEGIVRQKSFAFAIRIVALYRQLVEKKEFVISRQISRSGTAVGAMIREAEFAESGKDFIHKMSVAQKECSETLYWLDLLKETKYIDLETYENLNCDATELMKILTAIIKTRKKNLDLLPDK